MDSGSIKLTLSVHTCVAGGTVTGEVTLDFPLLQQEQVEEVHLKFRGSVYTHVDPRNLLHQSSNESVHRFISPARTDLNETRDVDIIRDQISLWSRGSAYPPPDSHTLSIPFLFNVPRDIPPSYESSTLESRAVVCYGVEAVGVRPGALRMNKRVFVPVVGLPVDPSGAQLRAILQAGWTGSWDTATKEKQIRFGFWGEHAEVSVEFKYPALKAFPIRTSMPFTLTIVTTSKSCKRTSGSDSKPIWPAPPVKPEDVRLELVRTAYIQTSHLTWAQRDRLSLLGNLGESGKGSSVQVQLTEKAWLSFDESKGRWRQRTSFTSSLNLTCVPSFKFPTLSVEYNITVVVPFTGLNNTLRLEVPIMVSSGMAPRNPPAHVVDYTAPPADDAAPPFDVEDFDLGRPLKPDLPPSYWNATE